MAHRVDLMYNPIHQSARLLIDGEPFDRPGSRVRKAIVGQPMARWLLPVTDSYRAWRGFLPELASEINEDAFQLVFSGNGDDFERFERAIRQQEAALPEIGLTLKNLEITHEEAFSTERLYARMRELRAEWKAEGLTRDLLRQRDALDRQLQQDGAAEDAYRLIDEYLLLLKRAQSEAAHTGGQGRLIEMRRAWAALKEGE